MNTTKGGSFSICVSLKFYVSKFIMEESLLIRFADKREIKENNSTCAFLETIPVIDIDRNPDKKTKTVGLIYTLQQGDNKKLNRDGVLRLYYLDQPIEVPVTKLLGKWKRTHVGVTLSCLYENWQIEEGEGQDQPMQYNHQYVQSAAEQPLLKFVFAIVKILLFKYILPSHWGRRIA